MKTSETCRKNKTSSFNSLFEMRAGVFRRGGGQDTRTFNSLFEMPPMEGTFLSHSATSLSFNSLFEMPPPVGVGEGGARDSCAFNSLFEMLDHASTLAPGLFRCTFNSLFEMLPLAHRGA